MALPAPYWIQTQPNRGTAPTLDTLPPKCDFLMHSADDFDRTFELLLSTGPDVYYNTDGATAEMAIWRETAGVLTLVDTLTEGDGRIILGAGIVRAIILAAEHEAYGASELYYNLGLTDAVPRTRQMAGGKLIFIDRLRTVQR